MTSHAFSPNRIDTLIGASTRIDGDIDYTGILRIQGEVKGDVVCREATDGGLVVDSAGGVVGTVTAPHIVVKGRFDGPAHSSQSIEVHQGGSLTGDVAFRRLIIHAGGVVNGTLTPTHDDNEPSEAPADAAGTASAPHPGSGKRKVGLAAGAALAVIAVIWASGWFSDGTPPTHDAAPALASPVGNAADEPAPADRAQPRREEPAGEIVAAAEPPASAPVPADTAASAEETVVVRGANPNRPVGVFLLIAHEPAILYRRQRDDTGSGTRLAADAGEKVSIAVDRDELVRVAKGRALDIYFQGQKVPRSLVERGVWISFVPTNGSPLP